MQKKELYFSRLLVDCCLVLRAGAAHSRTDALPPRDGRVLRAGAGRHIVCLTAGPGRFLPRRLCVVAREISAQGL